MSSEEHTIAANQEVLDAFTARHGDEQGRIMTVIWSVVAHQTGTCSSISGKVDADTFKTIVESFHRPTIQLLRLLRQDVVPDAVATLGVLSNRFLDMMSSDLGPADDSHGS